MSMNKTVEHIHENKDEKICRKKRLFSLQNAFSFFRTISICELTSLHLFTIFTKHGLDLIVDTLFLL